MIDVLKNALLISCLMMIFACGDDCSDNFNYVAETEVENANWRRADSIYNSNMTIENCNSLNRASDDLLSAFMDVKDCVSDSDQQSYEDAMSFIEAQKIAECN